MKENPSDLIPNPEELFKLDIPTMNRALVHFLTGIRKEKTAARYLYKTLYIMICAIVLDQSAKTTSILGQI
jgi:hypothetical protein